MHLKKLNIQLSKLEQQFLDVSVKQANNTNDAFLSDELTNIRKQISSLGIYSRLFADFNKLVSETQQCLELLSESKDDKEMRKMAEDDLETLSEQFNDLQYEIEDEAVPKRDIDGRNVTLEIRQAAGGSESSLFAADLVIMYKAYCQRMGWRCVQEDFQADMAIHKGCKLGVYKVTGEEVYKHLKHESGVHKVQRVPETEKQGRMHSSTATVTVMPEVPKEFSIDEKDIRIDTYRASGAGGQHVNKTDSAVRATHVPTGTIATCQDERDQHTNKARALEKLKQRMYAMFEEQEAAKESKFKRDQIGNGNINEKIRTYNWPNNRITDHRLGVTKFGIDNMLQTAELLEEFIDELNEQERAEKLKEIFGDVASSS